MTVTSREIEEGKAQRRSSHVISATQLSRAEPALYRFIAVLLWLFSFAGNVLMFAGGWAYVGLDRHTAVALGWSVGWQVVCTIVQFICCRHWLNPVYLLALTASFVPSFIGYRPIIAVPLTRWAAGIEGDVFASFWQLAEFGASAIMWAIAIHFLVAVALVAADVIPERVFVRH